MLVIRAARKYRTPSRRARHERYADMALLGGERLLGDHRLRVGLDIARIFREEGHAMSIKFAVQPRCVPLEKAAKRLHLSPSDFMAIRDRLEKRRFPRSDPDTGMYDLAAIDAWLDAQSGLRTPDQAADPVAAALARIEDMRRGSR